MKSNIKFKIFSTAMFLLLAFNFGLTNARATGKSSNEYTDNDYDDTEYIFYFNENNEEKEDKEDNEDNEEKENYVKENYYGMKTCEGYLNFYEKGKVKDFEDNMESMEKRELFLRRFLEFNNVVRFCVENFSFNDLHKNKPLEQQKEYIEKSFRNYMYEQKDVDSSQYNKEIKKFFIDNFVVEYGENNFFKLKVKVPENNELFLEMSEIIRKCLSQEDYLKSISNEEKDIYRIFLHVRTFIKFFNDAEKNKKNFEFIVDSYNAVTRGLSKLNENNDNVFFDVERYVMNNERKLNVNCDEDVEKEFTMGKEIKEFLKQYLGERDSAKNWLRFKDYVEFVKNYLKNNNLVFVGDIRKDEYASTSDMNIFFLYCFSQYLSDVLYNSTFFQMGSSTDKYKENFARQNSRLIPIPIKESFMDYPDEYLTLEERMEKAKYYAKLSEIEATNMKIEDFREERRKIFDANVDEIRKIFRELLKIRNCLLRSCFFKEENGIYKAKFRLLDLDEDDKNEYDKYGYSKSQNSNILTFGVKLSNEYVRRRICEFLRLFEIFNEDLYTKDYEEIPVEKLMSLDQIDRLSREQKYMYKYFLYVLAYIKAFNIASYNKNLVKIPFEFFGFTRKNWNFKSYAPLFYISKTRNLQRKFFQVEKQILDRLYEKNNDKLFDFMLDKSLNVKVNDEIKEDADKYYLAKYLSREKNFKEMFDKNITSNFDNEFTSLKDYLNFAKYYINEVKKIPSKTYIQDIAEKNSYLFSKDIGITDLYMDEFVINSFYNYLTYVINFLLAPTGFENKKFTSYYFDEKKAEFLSKNINVEEIPEDLEKSLTEKNEKFLKKLKDYRNFLLDLRDIFVQNCDVKRDKDGIYSRIIVNQNTFLNYLKKAIEKYNESSKQIDLTEIEDYEKLAYRFFLFVRAYVKILNYRFAKYKCEIPYLDYSEAIDGFNMNGNVLNYIAKVRKNKNDRLLKIRNSLEKNKKNLKKIINKNNNN